MMNSGCNKDTIDLPLLETVTKEGMLINRSAIDGCGFMIRLDDGEWLQPVVMDDKNFVFSDLTKVEVTYSLPDDAFATCADALPVHIHEIKTVGCHIIEAWPTLEGFVNHPLHSMDALYVDGTSLVMEGSLMGGCVNPAFALIRDGTCCDTTLTQPWNVHLFYNNMEDDCENLFHVKQCWSLYALQVAGADSVQFIIHYLLPDGPVQKPFTVFYN